MTDDEQLYVKVNAQGDIEQSLNELELKVEDVNNALEVLQEVRALKENAVQKIYNDLAELNNALQSIEQQLPGVTESERPVETPEIDGSVQELHSELETLQSELERLN